MQSKDQANHSTQRKERQAAENSLMAPISVDNVASLVSTTDKDMCQTCLQNATSDYEEDVDRDGDIDEGYLTGKPRLVEPVFLLIFFVYFQSAVIFPFLISLLLQANGLLRP
jgi:hypothetical protein